jgi:hypothetical protein
VLNKKQTES